MRKVLYLFSKFSDQDVDWLIGTGRRQEVKPGDVLIHEGRHTDSLFITLAGNYEVVKNEKVIATIGAGEVLGELSFLDSRPPVATNIATETGTVLSIASSRLNSKLRADTGFASRFYLALGIMLADRMRQTTSQLAYGRTLDESTEELDEIPADLLDSASVAAARFGRLREAVLTR